MAASGALLASVLQSLASACVAGISTRELDALASSLILFSHATPGFLHYRGFPFSLCVSINDEVIHGLPSSRRLLPGDLVSLDLGLILNGWWADAGLTIGLPPLAPLASSLIDVAHSSLLAGIAQARVGNFLGDISFASQSAVERRGFSLVHSYSGHGIGRAMHEEPVVPNLGSPHTGLPLRAGMVLAIEPMVIAGFPQVFVRPDGWTVATSDHSLASYWEHTVAITPSGPRILTALT